MQESHHVTRVNQGMEPGTNARTAYVLWWLDCVLGVFDGGRGYVYVWVLKSVGFRIRDATQPRIE